MEEMRKPIAWLWWTVAALMLLVAYPLSLGPAAWCIHAAGVTDGSHWACQTLEFVYAPIIKIAESSPNIEKVARRYVEFWTD